MKETVLEATRGDDNYLNVDLDATDIDPADTVTFNAGHNSDALTVLQKVRPTGVVDIDTVNGIVQVQLKQVDLQSITEEALLFEVVLHKADVNMTTTVAKGVLRLTS